MSEEIKELKEKLLYKQKMTYETMTAKENEETAAYAEGYKAFLDAAKTERECVTTSAKLAEEKGYKPYKLGEKMVVGGKYYYNNRGKSIYIFRIGSEDVENGVRVSASHIDYHRLDLKPHPLYEEGGIGYFKTHYYGGIKKYQWVTIPLALHGVVITKYGESVNITIGEDDNDPILYISDLLPHLAKDQMSRTAGQVIPGEKLNVMLGSIPIKYAAATVSDLNLRSFLTRNTELLKKISQAQSLI